ncbi:MAG: ATP-binding protein [Anaerolineae bacterium]
MSPLPTQFAPAERSTEAQIRHDTETYVKSSTIVAMLDAVPNLLLILNENRQAIFANEACLNLLNLRNRSELLGYRPGELIGCAHSTETPGGCGTSEYCRNCGAVKAILSSIKGAQSTQECRITLRNGDSLDLEATAKPLELNGRHFTVFTLTDIAGEKRRRALERIFFHDVLNTAGVLASSTEFMKIEPAEATSMIDDLYRASHQLIDEIRSQRDLIAAESGDLQAMPTIFSVADFVKGLVNQYSHHQSAEGRQLALDLGDAMIMLTTDQVLLGRVIGNMIKNALEASHEGDAITVGYTSDAHEVTFSVHNPTYIPHNHQLQIFNRSFSTKGSGRGLGTYSMKLLSERYLRGRVSFESTKENGTTFYAKFPLA